MRNSRKEIKELKLKANTALFWGSDCEDVKIIEGLSQEMFDKVWDLDEDKVAFLAGDNDGDMFEILFSMDDKTAYDLIEDYNEDWGKYIEIITE
jgi:hypothetical protein|tara:strand:- start:191 stop:472 length:282 start_codon:yes stop_codon:yes gene_type:complete